MTLVYNLAPVVGALNETSRGEKLAFAAVLVIVIGSIGPWVDFGGETAGGLDKDGVVTIALALIAAVYLFFTPRPHWAPTAALGALAGAVAIFDIIDIEDVAGVLGGFVNPGWGLYLTAIGSIALVLSAVLAMRTEGEADVPLGLAGKIIIGLAALLVALAAVAALDQPDVAEVEVPEPSRVEP